MRAYSSRQNQYLRQMLYVLAATIVCFAPSCFGADDEYFDLSETLKTLPVHWGRALPQIALYWADESTPLFVEQAPVSEYSGSEYHHNPLGGSRKSCLYAFDQAVAAMANDAARRGYDAVAGIHVKVGGQPADTPGGFHCKPGYNMTAVELAGAFSLTAEGARRAAAAEEASFNVPPRAPVDGAIFLSLGAVLDSPDMRFVLGSDVKAYVGRERPAYTRRYGSEVYSERLELKGLGAESACKDATLRVILAMADDARAKGFDTISGIRSYLNDAYPPSTDVVECAIGRKAVLVKLRASLINRVQ